MVATVKGFILTSNIWWLGWLHGGNAVLCRVYIRPCEFEVTSNDGKERISLKCDDQEECDDWITAISERIKRTIELKVAMLFFLIINIDYNFIS